MKKIHMVTFILLVVGGINWFLVGFFSFDLVQSVLGVDSIWTKIVYVIVGVSAVYELVTHKKNCTLCSSKSTSPDQPTV